MGPVVTAIGQKGKREACRSKACTLKFEVSNGLAVDALDALACNLLGVGNNLITDLRGTG